MPAEATTLAQVSSKALGPRACTGSQEQLGPAPERPCHGTSRSRPSLSLGAAQCPHRAAVRLSGRAQHQRHRGAQPAQRGPGSAPGHKQRVTAWKQPSLSGTRHRLILKVTMCWKAASGVSLEAAMGSPVVTLAWGPRCCERRQRCSALSTRLGSWFCSAFRL